MNIHLPAILMGIIILVTDIKYQEYLGNIM